jgi:DNA-binding NarL/FixJ family response regulator
MVDDHPIIIEGYQNVLMATKEDDQTLHIDTANNCDTASLMINRAAKEMPYDVCFFDISLPASEDGRFASGEDLALLTKKMLPNAKIIISYHVQ